MTSTPEKPGFAQASSSSTRQGAVLQGRATDGAKMATNGKICGRKYQATAVPQGVRPRIIVEGVNHPKAGPIRFKSLDRAERHIKNMRLEIKPAD